MYIFGWMTQDISMLMIELDGSPFVILLEGFSWVTPYRTHPANSGLESAKELPLFKRPPNKKFSSEDIDFSLIAALYHPLSIAVEIRALSIKGMKLMYCLHRSHSSVYTVYLFLNLHKVLNFLIPNMTYRISRKNIFSQKSRYSKFWTQSPK